MAKKTQNETLRERSDENRAAAHEHNKAQPSGKIGGKARELESATAEGERREFAQRDLDSAEPVGKRHQR